MESSANRVATEGLRFQRKPDEQGGVRKDENPLRVVGLSAAADPGLTRTRCQALRLRGEVPEVSGFGAVLPVCVPGIVRPDELPASL